MPTATNTPRHMEVATTIHRQILAAGVVVSGSWGMRQLLGLSAPDHLGALRFLVSGRRFTGKIEIALMPSDTYRVRLYRGTHDRLEPFVLADELEEVYAEDLVEVIDRRIESGPSDAAPWSEIAG